MKYNNTFLWTIVWYPALPKDDFWPLRGICVYCWKVWAPNSGYCVFVHMCSCWFSEYEWMLIVRHVRLSSDLFWRRQSAGLVQISGSVIVSYPAVWMCFEGNELFIIWDHFYLWSSILWNWRNRWMQGDILCFHRDQDKKEIDLVLFCGF